MSKTKRVAIYTRVSTDKQTVENQMQSLTKVAEHRGWQVVECYSDKGISGAKESKDRPSLDRLLTDASKGKIDVVMVWAIDRLGRSLIDLLRTVQRFDSYNVDLYIDQQNIDTTTPMGRLMFQVTGAFAEFERKMIVARVHAGLKRARANGTTLGRPKIDFGVETKIKSALKRGDMGIHRIADRYGVGTGTVQRIKAELGSRGH